MFDKIELHRNRGVMCVGLIEKVQDAECSIVEVPVYHDHRASGRSPFVHFRRLARTAVDVARLWVERVVRGRHRPASEVVDRS